MMDAYAHLDMSTQDPIEDLRLRMNSARIGRALIVETWGRDNYGCLEHLSASFASQFRVALCFRPEEKRPYLDILHQEMVVALRVKTADIRHLGSLTDTLESSGKWLLTHAEGGIKELKDELVLLTKLYPKLRIYLPHLGWPRRNKEDDKDWEDSISELGRLPSIIVGISAVEHFSRESYPHKDTERFAAQLLEVFGPDSVVIGSDYPMFDRDMYAQYIDLGQKWVQHRKTSVGSRFESNVFGATETSVLKPGPVRKARRSC